MELRSIITLGVIVLLLAGCNAQPADGQSSNTVTELFDIWIPQNASHKYLRSDKSIAYATYDAPTNDYQPSDFLVEIYPPASVSSSCSSSTIGASALSELADTNGKTVWAKMLLLNAYDRSINTVCQITAPDCTDRELFEGTCKTKSATYALCSENNEKTVFICISQVTDNEAFAKKIFETFRWTK